MSSNSRREQIVAAAARLFEENGYHTTNVAEVAEAAGISKPTLYHYFKSKEEILFEIHEEFIRYVTAKQAERMGTGLSPTDSRFPQICVRTDRQSTYEQWNLSLEQALKNEGRLGAAPIMNEAGSGASRFAGGVGRGGSFADV